jgi:IS5 family transposase
MREVSSGFEALAKIFDSLDLGFAEKILSEAYRPEGSAGRPHRNLVGMFKAELAKRLGGIESYRELGRLLETDEALRSLCEIRRHEKPYDRATISRFRRRVGPEKLERIMMFLVRQLDKRGVLDCEALALDATFIEAYSRRDPEDNSRGLFDSEARLRRQGKNVVLGYGVHLAVDAGSEMPLAVVVVPANVNEKKISIPLLRRVGKHRRRMRSVVADSQYSSEAFRSEARRVGADSVVPYPRNQMRGERVLRVDKRFRSHGPWRLKRLYRQRSAVERTVSRLKTYFGLCQVRTRGLRNVLSHVLLCLISMLLTALSAIKQGFPGKMRSVIFWRNQHV